MKQEILTTDEIILRAIREKHSFQRHEQDISYACHHRKQWLYVNVDGLKKEYDKDTLTFSQLKKSIDKLVKVK